jgi:hypothetical protein
MKKMSYPILFIISLVACAVPTYVLVSYFGTAKVLEGGGAGYILMLSVIVSMLPALLISIWWWNYQHDDDEDYE